MMTPAHRCLNAGRALLARHAVAGFVPALELRVWLAEMAAALDAEPPRERANLDHAPHPPLELPPR